MTAEIKQNKLVKQYLNHEIELYSLFKPPGRDIASIYSTSRDGLMTYVEVIERDDVYRACAEYLEAVGAPCFPDVQQHDQYVDELEHQLRQGLAPAAARAEGLRAVGR